MLTINPYVAESFLLSEAYSLVFPEEALMGTTSLEFSHIDNSLCPLYLKMYIAQCISLAHIFLSVLNMLLNFLLTYSMAIRVSD